MTRDEFEGYRKIVDLVVSAVPCTEAGHALGIKTDYKGRCQCFIHGGTNKNLKLYDGDRGYYCFVCHAYGNVVDLVMKYLKVSFMDALEWLNESIDLRLDMNKNSFRNRRSRAEAYAKKKGGVAS